MTTANDALIAQAEADRDEYIDIAERLETKLNQALARNAELEQALHQIVDKHGRDTYDLDDGWSVAGGLADIARAALAKDNA